MCFSFSCPSVFIVLVPTVIIIFQSCQSSTINNESVFAWNPTRGAIIQGWWECNPASVIKIHWEPERRTLMSPSRPGCIHHQPRRYSPLMPGCLPAQIYSSPPSEMNSWTRRPIQTSTICLAGKYEWAWHTLGEAQNVLWHISTGWTTKWFKIAHLHHIIVDITWHC